MIAFLKKDVLEQLRSGRLTILCLLSVLFGIMNPAIAKLTPWLLETMSDTLASTGMIVTEVTVSALDSWVQFFKNLPMALIAFVLLESSIFTREYRTGTLILSLTKGLPRCAVVFSKAIVLSILWTLSYWLHFGITWVYSDFFWDNSVAQNLLYAAGVWWLFGLWVVALMLLFSTLSRSNTGVLIGTGGMVLASSLLAMFPRLREYLPTLLTDGNSLIYGLAETDSYTTSLLITAGLGAFCFAVSFPIFNKKQL